MYKYVQEIRNSGAIGYKYITVDEDEAANVIYANNVLLHLANELIPRGSAVSEASILELQKLTINHALLINQSASRSFNSPKIVQITVAIMWRE